MDSKQLQKDMEAAHQFKGDCRAMRVTLECSHIRLMPYINCIMGIGSFTRCIICEPERGKDRLVVNIEETGVLWQEGW